RSSDMACDRLDLRVPAAGVTAVRRFAASGRQRVEAGFGDGEVRLGLADRAEQEGDEGSRLARVVAVRVLLLSIRLPPPRDAVGRLDVDDRHVPHEVTIALVGDLPAHPRARRELALGDVDAEPAAELLGVGDGAPDAGDGGA